MTVSTVALAMQPATSPQVMSQGVNLGTTTQSLKASQSETATSSQNQTQNQNEHNQFDQQNSKSIQFMKAMENLHKEKAQRVIKDVNSPMKMGPESGGGGGVVKIQGLVFLLDLFNTPLTEKAAGSYTESSSKISAASEKSFTAKDAEQDVAFHKALAILNAWKELSYDVIVRYIEPTLRRSSLQWRFVDEVLPKIDFFIPMTVQNAGVANNDVMTAAFYKGSTATESSVNISRSLWNQMALQSQTGLVLHETLRYVQIAEKQGFDDRTLQQVTAILLTCQPSVKLDFYMMYLLSQDPQSVYDRYGDFDSFVNKNCEVLK
jgi:hypothetical protein